MGDNDDGALSEINRINDVRNAIMIDALQLPNIARFGFANVYGIAWRVLEIAFDGAWSVVKIGVSVLADAREEVFDAGALQRSHDNKPA